MIKNSTTSEMKTLSDCINKQVLNGYTEDFKASEDENKLISVQTEKTYNPEDVNVVNFYRFEGASDPSDNAILYVIEGKDGAKGTLVDAYGPYADDNVEEFMQKVDEINKKPAKNDQPAH